MRYNLPLLFLCALPLFSQNHSRFDPPFTFAQQSINQLPKELPADSWTGLSEQHGILECFAKLSPEGIASHHEWKVCPEDLKDPLFPSLVFLINSIKFSPATVNGVPQWSKIFVKIKIDKANNCIQIQVASACPKPNECIWISIPKK